MAIDNLISVSFTDEELAQIKKAMAGIATVLNGKTVNLTPQERQQYGRIADKNKVFVDKCKAYMEQVADLVPANLDKAEFDADYKARTQIEPIYRELSRLAEKLQDTKTLLDHDNYTAAISYYRYIKYLASTSEPGTTTMYEDMRKHFQAVGKAPEGTVDTPTGSVEAPEAGI